MIYNENRMTRITQENLGWESHLIRRAQSGDRDALELLMEMHHQALVTHARRYLHSREDAEDVVQDTLLRAVHHLDEFEPHRSLRPWLLRICTNRCIDRIRHHRRRGTTLPLLPEVLSELRDEERMSWEDSELTDQIREAVMRLPQNYREIIEMRHYRDMNIREIATAMQRPEGTVKSWLSRARDLLRVELTPSPAEQGFLM